MIQVLDIIQKVIIEYGDEPSPAGALELFKKLPKSFDDYILNDDMERFEEDFRVLYPALKMNKNDLLRMERKGISEFIKNEMDRLNISVNDLSKEVDIARYAVQEMIDGSSNLSIYHMQKILDYFGLSIYTVSRVELFKNINIIPKDETSDDTAETPTEENNNVDEGAGTDAETAEETTETTNEEESSGDAKETTETEIPEPIQP